MKFLFVVIACIGILFSLGCQSGRTVGVGYKTNSVSSNISLGKVDKVKDYLARNGNPNAKNNYGWSLLQDSAIHNKPEITKLLLKAGANPNLPDTIGRTPIFWAKSPEVVEALLNAGADVNVVDITGKTVLQLAQSKVVTYQKQTGAIWKQMISTQQSIIDVLKGGGLPDFLRYAKAGQLNELKTVLTGNIASQERDTNGNTAMHLAAAASHNGVVDYLLKKGYPTNVKNQAGKTPLDLVRDLKNKSAKLLSCADNKHCRSVAGFEVMLAKACDVKSSHQQCLKAVAKDTHGVFITSDISEKMAEYAFKNSCEKFSYLACKKFTDQFSNYTRVSDARQIIRDYIPKAQKAFDISCGENGTVNKCKDVVDRHPGLFEKESIELALLYLGQKCRLKENGWLYKSNQCQSGFAHGAGEAVNLAKNLSFKGRFEKGHRLKGKVYYQNQPMFDGTLTDGKPNGVGICFYKNEPEKCEYYEGKRVDVLYKQRIALADQERKIDAKLAEMKKMQQTQNNRINQMQSRSTVSRTNKSSPSVGQQIGDYALKKAGEKVMDSLFDKLF